MNYRVVNSKLADLLVGIFVVVANEVCKSASEREMAGRVFVKEGVVEKKSRLADRRGLGHERALAKICRALVHRDYLAEQVCVFLSTDLNGASALEFNPEVIDKLSCIGKRS